jgi:hypothetical protein
LASSDSTAADRVQVQVIYIGGWGRSGSTLLSCILGGFPDFVSVGELRYLWSGGVAANELCSCREPFHSCPFWGAVGDRAYGGWSSVDVEEVLSLERAIFARRQVALLLAPRLKPAYERLVRSYTERIVPLYRAIRDVSGCSYVVDSTKDPPYAFLLRRASELRLHLVHLVRDGRASAFAWSKEVRRPEVTGREAYFARYGTATSAFLWSGGNAVLHLLREPQVTRRLMRYESLATDPKPQIESLLHDLGVDGYDLSALERHEVLVDAGHTIRGNPLRFESGYRPIRLDDEWRTKMPRLRKAGFTAATWPLLWRYGYLGRRGRASG